MYVLVSFYGLTVLESNLIIHTPIQEALERLARHLPGGGEAPAVAASAAPQGAYRYALEFRHPSWYDPEVYAVRMCAVVISIWLLVLCGLDWMSCSMSLDLVHDATLTRPRIASQFMRRQGWGLVQHALIHNIHPEKGIPEVRVVQNRTSSLAYLPFTTAAAHCHRSMR